MKTKNICIVLLFLVINSAVFAQKVELIREIKLNGNLSEIYNETFSNPLSVGIDTVKGKASCYYTPYIFIDENNIFFTVAGNKIYLYNYLNNTGHAYVMSPGNRYTYCSIFFISSDYCIFSAYDIMEDLETYFKFYFHNETYEMISETERKNELSKRARNEDKHKLLIRCIQDEEIDNCIYEYFFKYSETMGKSAIAGKHNNFFQILKDSDGRDVLYSKEIIPVFNSDCTKLFCITNVSYDSEKIIEDDYTIYIYDITY
ncbi:MAG: hypothetical protein IIT68_06335 [Treponema sp.]|nr:hypothetical protein [Treponema sp.]